MKSAIIVVSTGLLLAGCSTYAADRYSVSMDSQEELQTVSTEAPGRKVDVSRFSASKPGQTEIGCRAVAPIKTPDGEPFEEYIRKALIDQLRLAQLYSPDGAVHITGNLDYINFSSHQGIWSLTVTVSDEANNSFVVREDYDYQSSFVGDTACSQTAQALMPAVQNLIRKIVSTPDFKAMLTGRSETVGIT
ncbi:MAG: hypothetical protein ACXW3U_14815 [Rhodoplanes sp.]